MIRYIVNIASLLLLSIVFNCERSTESITRENELARNIWKVYSDYQSGSPIYIVPVETSYLFKFDEDYKITGWSEGENVCNYCNGEYSLGNKSTILIDITCTEMACNDLPGYGWLLDFAYKYEIMEGELKLYYEQWNNYKGYLVLKCQ